MFGKVFVYFIVALACARTTYADDGHPQEETASSWYGWQTFIVDAGAAGLMAMAGLADDAKYASSSKNAYRTASTSFAILAFATYAFGAPVLHLARGQNDNAWKSLELRLGLPVGGALLGVVMGGRGCGTDGDVPCSVVAGAIGAIVGGVAAVLIDGVFVARQSAVRKTSLRMATMVVPTVGGGAWLVAGSF